MAPCPITSARSEIDMAMLMPLLIMALGFTLLFAVLLLMRMRTVLNERRVRALMMQAAGRGEVTAVPRPAAAAMSPGQ